MSLKRVLFMRKFGVDLVRLDATCPRNSRASGQQRYLILLVILAGATMPTLAQTLIPSIGQARTSTKDETSIPDFSGTWAHPFYPGFELPLSGPAPVTNRSRNRQFLDNDGRPRLRATKPLLVDHPSQLVGDYTNPILKPDAAEIAKKSMANSN
jgi:hypothetical protein